MKLLMNACLIGLIFIFPTILQAENDYLIGKLVTYSSDGFEMPMDGLEVSIQHTTIETKTDDRGMFKLNLRKNQNAYKDQLKAGRKITLKLKDPNWFILTPYEGSFFLPKYLDDFELKVIVAFHQSKINFGAFNAVFSSNKTNSKRLKYAVQVMSTTSELSAYTVMDNLKQFGYKSSVDFVNGKNDKNIYKVFSGIYTSRAIAKNEAAKIKKKYKQHNDAFIKLILK